MNWQAPILFDTGWSLHIRPIIPEVITIGACLRLKPASYHTYHNDDGSQQYG